MSSQAPFPPKPPNPGGSVFQTLQGPTGTIFTPNGTPLRIKPTAPFLATVMETDECDAEGLSLISLNSAGQFGIENQPEPDNTPFPTYSSGIKKSPTPSKLILSVPAIIRIYLYL